MTSWEKNGRESDRAFYLEAWNGNGSFTVDRIIRGTIFVENLCLSIFGGTQPDKILTYLHKSLYSMENDGLLQRFQLLAYPDKIAEWNYVDRLPNKAAKQVLDKIVESILTPYFFEHLFDVEIIKGIKCLSFCKEAQTVFIEWIEEHQKRLNTPDEAIIIQHLAKYRKLMPALALIFHIIDVAAGLQNTGKITVQSTIRAAAGCNYLESHARRIYEMALNISAQAASVLLQKIKQGNLSDRFSLRDVYRKGWKLLKDKDVAEAACEELTKAFWIKKDKNDYIVNPKVSILKTSGDAA